MTQEPRRIALVTGAAGGLGAVIATHFAREGYHTIVQDRSEQVRALSERLSAQGHCVEHAVFDVTSETAVKAFFKELDERCGRFDILVNNAGVSPKHDGKSLTAEATSLQEWQFVLDVNLTSPFLLCREAAPLMRRNNWGRIVNMASLAGRTRSIVSGAHYSASKAGLIGFSRMFAGEVAKAGITVNCVAPGSIEAGLATQIRSSVTAPYLERIPVGRFGKPEEVASLVAYIASEHTGFITGATFDINGGFLMA